MKLVKLSAIALSASLVACASTHKAEAPVPQAVAQPAPQVYQAPVHPYAMPAQPVRAVVSAPNLLFDMKIREDIAKLPKKDKYTKNF
jgi:hypothetical protein